jgi:hypothetical protein
MKRISYGRATQQSSERDNSSSELGYRDGKLHLCTYSISRENFNPNGQSPGFHSSLKKGYPHCDDESCYMIT